MIRLRIFLQNHSTSVLLIIACVYLFSFSAKALVNKKTVYGDGIFYYSWLRSITIDHDISFTNEYDFFHVSQFPTKTNRIGNIYAIGPAIFLFPFYILIHTIFHGNGFTFEYQFATGFISVFFTLSGIYILWQTMKKVYADFFVTLAIISLAFATNLFFYGALDTVNSHSFSFFVSCVLFASLIEKKSLFVSSILVGLAGIIRMQDTLLGVFLLPQLISPLKYGLQHSAVRQFAINLTASIVGFLLGLMPQLIAWHFLYGTFLTNPYLANGFGFKLFAPHVLDVLFSQQNGLFYWTPVIVVGLVGVLLIRSTSIINKWLILLFGGLQLYVVGSWIIWWQGASFSGRMFISLLPFITLGFAEIYKRLPQNLSMLTTFLFSITNMLFIFNFLREL